MKASPKLASEEFLPPVHRFNDAVGPMFGAFQGRFPLSEHTENGLSHSLGIFLGHVYHTALEQMAKLKPEPLSREQWNVTSPAIKEKHMHWQRNLKYLKRRNTDLMRLLSPNSNRVTDSEPF